MLQKNKRVMVVPFSNDDLLVAGIFLQFVIDVKNASCACFEMESCEEAKLCLKIEMTKEPFCIYIRYRSRDLHLQNIALF